MLRRHGRRRGRDLHDVGMHGHRRAGRRARRRGRRRARGRRRGHGGFARRAPRSQAPRKRPVTASRARPALARTATRERARAAGQVLGARHELRRILPRARLHGVVAAEARDDHEERESQPAARASATRLVHGRWRGLIGEAEGRRRPDRVVRARDASRSRGPGRGTGWAGCAAAGCERDARARRAAGLERDREKG